MKKYPLSSQNSEKKQQIFIGVMIFMVQKENWEALSYYQSDYDSLVQQIGQMQANKLHRCNYFVKVDQNHTWINKSYLSIEFNQPKGIENCQALVDQCSQQQKQTMILKMNIQEVRVIKTVLINLIENQIIRFESPRTIKDDQYLGQFQNNSGSELKIYPISVRVFVREEFLINSTQYYHLNKQKKNEEMQNNSQKQFIKLLMILRKQEDLSKGMKYLAQKQNQGIKSLAAIKASQIINQSSKSRNKPQSKSFFLNISKETGFYMNLDEKYTQLPPIPIGFIGQLKEYQKYGLSWMLFRQDRPLKVGVDTTHTPYWKSFDQELKLSYPLMINIHQSFIVWKQRVFKKCKGGILADQMGLGKTVMTIALILSHRPTSSDKTLIIVPFGLIKQWKNQIGKFAPGLKVLIANQQELSEETLNLADVVIVSFSKIRKNIQSKNLSIFLIYRFFRIVIDQAHSISNSKAKTSISLLKLQAEYKWCLTGTPIQNSIQDLYSLIRFLEFKPWCEDNFWEGSFEKCPGQKKADVQKLQIAKSLLKGITLRRKKQSVRIEGENNLNVQKIDVSCVSMSKEARELYNQFDYHLKTNFQRVEQLNKNIEEEDLDEAKPIFRRQKRKSIEEIWVLMMKMRMLCCHQFLLDYSSTYVLPQNFYNSYIKFLRKKKIVRIPKYNFFDQYWLEDQQKINLNKRSSEFHIYETGWEERLKVIISNKNNYCMKCKTNVKLQLTPCLHIFCKYCAKDMFFVANKNQREKDPQKFQFCPVCHDQIKYNQIYNLPRINQFNRNLDDFKQNEKIKGLINFLTLMNPADKAIVYTCFLGMMKLIGITLERNSISYLTINGDDETEARERKIFQFAQNPLNKVLIITLKTGSLGLNLQCANKVVFMDSWWNPAVELQAIGRVNRIGQKKQIQVKKFVTQNSIEVKILKYFISKKIISDSILDIDDILSNRQNEQKDEYKQIYNMSDYYIPSTDEAQVEQKAVSQNKDYIKIEQIFPPKLRQLDLISLPIEIRSENQGQENQMQDQQGLQNGSL